MLNSLPFKNNCVINSEIIVMIDSITKLCLSLLLCTNGLSYSGEETRPTLCIKEGIGIYRLIDFFREKKETVLSCSLDL